MAVAAPEIVFVVLGPQWTGAIEVLPWLLLASSLAMVGHFAGVVTEAQAALNGKMIVAGTRPQRWLCFCSLPAGVP